MKRLDGVDPFRIMKGVKRRISEDYVFVKRRGGYERFPRFKSMRNYDTFGRVKRNECWWTMYPVSGLKLDTIMQCEYDKKERMLICRVHDLKNRLRTKEICVYNKYNRVEKYTLIQCGRNEEPVNAHIYRCMYDDHGRLTDMFFVSSEFKDGHTHYTYDAQGLRRRENESVETGEIENAYIYEYEDDKEIIRYPGGDLSVTIQEKNMEIYKSFTPKGVLMGQSVRKYNKRGHMISQEVTDYRCDCTGVHIMPRNLIQVTYEYY